MRECAVESEREKEKFLYHNCKFHFLGANFYRSKFMARLDLSMFVGETNGPGLGTVKVSFESGSFH